jgi:glucan phosphoethanolaminetransferase (alkaline phosphatase superfamily)
MAFNLRQCSFGRFLFLLLIAALLVSPSLTYAGMPSALREDFETVLRLRESPHQRFQAISFFLMGIFASTLVVRFLWNFVAKDFPRLPKLTFLRALSVVLLWGLLFVIVLTMISGARELMTPGAWKKEGLTYSVNDATTK